MPLALGVVGVAGPKGMPLAFESRRSDFFIATEFTEDLEKRNRVSEVYFLLLCVLRG
jgi:hypothetical protein